MTAPLDLKALIRRADLQPKTVQNVAFDAVVSFYDRPVRARDDWVAALGLELGNTISISGTFSGNAEDSPSRHAHFFAMGHMADQIEQCRSKKSCYLRLQVLTGEGRETELTRDDGIHSYPTCIVGFLILDVHGQN